jgi:hypothetical protein
MRRREDETTGRRDVLLIACGAIARELVELRRLHQWDHVELQCLPADLHNDPERITTEVRALIEESRERYEHICVAYGDCGTGGRLDAMLAEFGIERLPGAHCYELLSGTAVFRGLADAEPGTFYLTDFLVRNFDRLVRRGLGLDRYPQLLPTYFGNYERLVYLSQLNDPALDEQARAHAAFLGLEYARHHCGFEPLAHAVSEGIVRWQG